MFVWASVCSSLPKDDASAVVSERAPPARRGPSLHGERHAACCWWSMDLSEDAALWIDHHEARIIHLRGEHAEETVVAAPRAHGHRHPKGPTEEHHHPGDMHRFFLDVTQAIGSVRHLLIVGPSIAKTQFARYLQEHGHALAPDVTIETADHPSDRQLAAYARAHYSKMSTSGGESAVVRSRPLRGFA